MIKPRRTPSDREIADYLYGICETRTEEYAIGEITRRLAVAREEGKQAAAQETSRAWQEFLGDLNVIRIEDQT